MTTWNHAKKELFVKIVYYGPGLCGKTTNLEYLYAKTPEKDRGDKKTTLNTETDRTLFFDYHLMEVGLVGGFKTKLQIFTVPGQVFYNQTRKLVLKGADGVVFVADSQAQCRELNKESLDNLRANLETEGLKLEDLPLVFQWNKQDLANLTPVEVLESDLNPRGLPSFKSVAITGQGVFETLREVVRLAIGRIREQEIVAPDTKSDVLGTTSLTADDL